MSNLRGSGIVNIIVAVCMATVMLSSCNGSSRPLWQSFEKISTDGWDPADRIVFDSIVPSADRTNNNKHCELELSFRYSGRRVIKPFVVAIAIDEGTAAEHCDTIAIELFSREGKPVGKGTYGVYQSVITIDSCYHPEATRTVSISPLAMRETTQGLLNVGLSLQPR